MHRVAIFGPVTPAGQDFLRLLERQPLPLAELRLLAEDFSVGRRVTFQERSIPIRAANTQSFQNIDLAIFFAGQDASARFAPIAVKSGSFVVDTSSAFRTEAAIPCVISALNGDDLTARARIACTPTPATLLLAVTLHAIHRAAGLRRVAAATYHAVSDLGQTAFEELNSQTRLVLEGRSAIPHLYPHQLAFNVIPEVDVFLDNGYTREEALISSGVQRLLRLPDLPISITAVRVPVYFGHSAAVHVDLEEYLRPDEARAIFAGVPGIKVLDEPDIGLYPLPWDVTYREEIVVGRVREDLASTNGLAFWAVVDNVRRGTALAALDLALAAINRGLVGKRRQLVEPPSRQ